jgi:hypothetical protein
VPNYLDAEQVLKEIEIQQGILVERARDAYSFSHLTFQEYLTAKCIVDNQKIDQLVRDHATDEHWREVFLLVAGLAPGQTGADSLLLAMEWQAQTFLESDKLVTLIAWSDAVTNISPGDISSAAKRAAAVFIAFDFIPVLILDRPRALARALARALDLAPILSLILDLDLAEEYKSLGVFNENILDKWTVVLGNFKAIVRNQKNSGKTYKEVKTIIINSFFEIFTLDIETIQFSQMEVEKISNYFYLLELMVRCKEAAVRVSPQVWQGIESRMLTVPKEDGG